MKSKRGLKTGKKWTAHKLSDAQLMRLSQIVNQRPHQFGVALYALERKGLIEHTNPGAGSSSAYTPTKAGIQALMDARCEGW